TAPIGYPDKLAVRHRKKREWQRNEWHRAVEPPRANSTRGLPRFWLDCWGLGAGSTDQSHQAKRPLRHRERVSGAESEVRSCDLAVELQRGRKRPDAGLCEDRGGQEDRSDIPRSTAHSDLRDRDGACSRGRYSGERIRWR